MRVSLLVICLLLGFSGWARAQFENEPSPFERCKVIVDHEERYGLWPEDREPPQGWRDTGFRGAHQECLDYIARVWTDMRPLSQRKPPDSPSP
jgi:MbtH protein